LKIMIFGQRLRVSFCNVVFSSRINIICIG
jgi:hypothetical protein